jgi:hypothetical protein
MSGSTGPVYLRWREGTAKAPELEQFATLDAALDAVEARWDTLQHQVPQILDARKVLLISTADIETAMSLPEDEEEGAAGTP